MRWEGDRPRRRRGVDRPPRARRRARCWPRPEVDGDPRPARTRPAAAAGRPAAAPPAHRPQPDGDRRAAHGPVRARRRRQRLPRRAAVPARRLAVPARPRRRRRRCGARMWADLVTLMRAGVRLGRIVTTRPGAPVPPPRRGPARGRPLRLPAHRAALPGLRHRGAHRGDGRPQPLLVPDLPGRLSLTQSDEPVPPTACHSALGPVYVRAPMMHVLRRCGRRRPGGRRRRCWPRPARRPPRPDAGRLRRLLPAVRRRRCPGTARSPSSGSTAGSRRGPTRAWPRSSTWAWESTGAVPAQPRAQLYLNTANPGEVRDQVTTWPTTRRDALRRVRRHQLARPARGSTAGSARRTASPSFFTPAAREAAGRRPAAAATCGGSTSRR